MSTVQHDLEAVGKELGDALMEQFNDILESGAEKLDGPVRLISARLAIAARRKDQGLMEACQDQLSLLVQESEIEVKGSAAGVMDFLVERGITLLVNGAIGGLAGLKVVG